jgi:hypothetical protein
MKIGDLVQPTKDYIADLRDEKTPKKKFGIIINTNEDMWGEYEQTGTKVRWSSGEHEIVWHFEIERAEK